MKTAPRLAVVGVGLMGGSLGMALRRRGWRVTGIGRNAARLKKAVARGAIDDFTLDAAAGVRKADVVVLACPVGEIVPLARRLWGHLKPGALVTDLGSVKGPIVKALTVLSGAAVFVGAHPMCGSEKTGVENARPDLYNGSVCVLTPVRGTPQKSLAAARRFWGATGARLTNMDAEEHDRAVAMVSHVPHLLAGALVLGGFPHRAVAAGSFRDMTRVAGADPAQWSQIFAMNRKALREALGEVRRLLDGLLRGGPSEKTLREIQRLKSRVS